MKIVIRKGTEPWKVVESTGYNDEGHLQALVAEDPTLVPVADLGAAAPPYIVAVREVTLRGSGSLDILAFNALGDMGVMECKLADNPEIRRKVIGQIVEYAAFLYRLDYAELDEVVMRRTGKRLHRLVEEKAGDPDWDAAEFQAAVERNLAEGRFTLIIVVDRMEETLGVTLEYLNACALRNVTLHALEMSHLSDGGLEILIPQVFGAAQRQSAAADGGKRAWNEEEYLRQAAERLDPDGLGQTRRLLDFAKQNADRVSWGKGKTGSMSFQVLAQGRAVTVFSLFTDGYLFVGFGNVFKVDEGAAGALRDALSGMPAFQGAQFSEGKSPGCKLHELGPGLEGFLAAVLALKVSIRRD